MKVSLKILLSAFVVLTLVQCKTRKPDDVTGELSGEVLSNYKAAKKDFTMFKLDETNQITRLKSAYDKMQPGADLMNDVQKSSNPDFWVLYGDINAAILKIQKNSIVNETSINDLFKSIDLKTVHGVEAYRTALSATGQKLERLNALKGLKSIQYDLNELTLFTQKKGDYEATYEHGMLQTEIHELLRSNDYGSAFNDNAFANHQYVMAMVCIQLKKNEEAKNLLLKLRDDDYDDPGVYNNLYKLASLNDDLEAAAKYLEEGREKFPDDLSMLFSQINYFQEKNDSRKLIELIPKAIQLEPENKTLYSVLGSAYGDISRISYRSGDSKNGEKNFNSAIGILVQANTKFPDDFNINYGLGALYFNRAADLTTESNKISQDFSKEGMMQYDRMRAEITTLFNSSLPYFKKCEHINPSDINTLIALKQVFASTEDMVMYKEFKDRLDKVTRGETIARSYF